MAQEFANITEITHACEAFVISLEEERYYDAHEDLEPLWFSRRFEENDEVKLWKGFINAAVSFELVKRGRHEASLKAWKNYHKYRELLGKFETDHYEMYVRMVKIIEKQDSRLRGNDERES
ncbi:MAG: DUF309 domain-containing protein [Sulfuricurvum sp.]|uniref:DUF309 domain-containing protein n=1 Tax=Sulfuricurvum sp. TaxID=2025608 RepID=UPI00261BAE7D|nr:DUF309 domain-containing protein [Sulfuricurvum sp.]MDD2828358.1 DUF309 domain-containing protein [Sulfuricurvum sp.]MDD4949363.1 DUF309 domain-containing protein [Sulfuricurvum sp.]